MAQLHWWTENVRLVMISGKKTR